MSANVQDNAEERSNRTGSPRTGNGTATWVLLGLILIAGGVLRFTGIDWDEGQHLHPDERFLTMVTDSLRWPTSLAQYFDTASNPLNPYNSGYGSYVYGLSPVIVAKALGELTGYSGYGGVYLAGRAMSGIMDLLSILLVFLIGRRLYDRRVGLLGALLLSLSVLTIQNAHFYTVDPTMTFYVTLALYLAVRVAQGGGWGSMVSLGVAFGLAVSAKISVLSFLGVIGLALIYRTVAAWRRAPEEPRTAAQGWARRVGRLTLAVRVEPPASGERRSPVDDLLVRAGRAVVALAVILVVAGVTFRIVQPQAFMGPGFFGLSLNPTWLMDMDGIQRLVTGEADYPPSHQWTAREPVWYALKNLILWGQGLPLGLAVWAAWGLMAWEMAKGRWQHLLPWAWMTFTFFYQSVQFVKTVRYMLPIYPTMALIAAYGLVRAVQLARQSAARPRAGRIRRLLPALAIGSGLVVVLGTTAWATAFAGIYTRPVTRVEASRWIYENIPAGSAITHEMWDDALPLNVDGHNAAAEYVGVQMEPYWEDTPEKREAMVAWLEQADYIILSSNRLYESIPRLPMRYPMTTRYYEALFSGELGFERLKTFTSRPTLFGIGIVDDYADETFTVYDHPKVIIFRKGPDFSMAAVRAMFEPYDLERVVRLQPIEVTRAPNALMLDAGTWLAQQAGGTWSALFRRGDLANRAPTAAWLLAITLLGWATAPIGFYLFGRLRDHGWILGRTLGMVLLGYPVWLVASLRIAPNTRATIVVVLAGLVALAAVAAWVQRRALGAFLRERWRLVVVNELLFLVFFAAFLFIRRSNPDLWHPVMGGEKPMDLAYLNAILKSTWFPPYDPWFAGGYLNYYYLGHVLVATLIKLTGVVPSVAYNLVIPTLFAMTAMGACCVVYNLVPRGPDEGRWLPRALRYGLLGALLVAVLGNLGEAQLLLAGLRELGVDASAGSVPLLGGLAQVVAGVGKLLGGAQMPFRPEWWYWNASRIMANGEINEFPFFSFLYADLHAHLIALPLTVLVLAMSVGLVVRPEGGMAGIERHGLRGLFPPGMAVRLAALALAVGILWGTNTWDYPTYLGLALAGLAIDAYYERGRADLAAFGRLAARGAVVIVLSLALFAPYHANYGSAYSSFGLWHGERTTLVAYLTINAPQLLLAATWLGVALADRRTRNSLVRAVRPWLRGAGRPARARRLYDALVRRQSVAYELAWFGVALVAAVLVFALLRGAWSVLLGLPLVVLGLALALDRGAPPEERWTAMLIAVGAALTIGVDYLVLEGDIGRMNTVFKFSLQVWVLWGIAGAVGLARIWPALRRWGEGARSAWRAGLAVLVLCAALYPVFGTWGKVNDRWGTDQPHGLDGMAYMTTARYADQGTEFDLSADYRAILWLQDNIPGSPVILEGNTPLYRWGSRISVYTGLPTIVGWDWHQRQQRAAYSGQVVDWRLQDVATLYNGEDVAQAEALLQRYGVSLIYIGELERAYYAPAGLAKFERMIGSGLEVIYEDGPVTIYRVVGGQVASGGTAGTGAGEHTASSAIGRARNWLDRNLLGGPVYADGPADASSSTPMLAGEVEDLPIADGRGWNAPAARSTLWAIVSWWVVLQVIGLAAWPLVARLAGNLPDAGYSLSKGIGLLVGGYLLWLGSSLRLVMNSPRQAWLAVLALAAIGFFVCGRQCRPLRAAWSRARRLILWEEALASAAFLALVAVRLANPDLWQPWFGGEKPMEMAFLNAILKSAYMPPYDPYFAGGTINYYYYGHYLMAFLVRLSGVRPEVGFNLAVPTLFALTVSHAWVLGTHLAGSRRNAQAGAACVALLAVMGNLTTPVQLLNGLARVGGAATQDLTQVPWGQWQAMGAGLWRLVRGEGTLPALDYWYAATRLIPGTINEFPFFSALFADLHPHMIAIPFTLVVLGLLWLWWDGERPDRRTQVGRLLLLAVTLGALGPMNTWDVPVYGGLTVLVLAGRGVRDAGRRGLARGALTGAAVVGAALLLYLPFYLHFSGPGVHLGLVRAGGRSPAGAFSTVWGTQAFLAVSVLGMALWGTRNTARRLARLSAQYGVIRCFRRLRGLCPAFAARCAAATAALVTGIAGAIALGAAGEGLLAALTLGLGAALAALTTAQGAADVARRALLAVGIGVILATEVVYLSDFLDGSDWRRMNTVFKFQSQAWVLLALALGSELPALWARVTRRRSLPRVLWAGATIGLVGAGLSYAVWAVPQRAAERFPGVAAGAGTLDGTAFMADAVYLWPDADSRIEMSWDLEALRWLWRNVPGTPVLAQADVGYYREGGLMPTSYSGLPTIVGMHAAEQRPGEQVAARQRDVRLLYSTTDEAEARTLLGRYDVRYVYVGQLERAVYPGEGLAKFEQMAASGGLVRAFRNERVTIYRVPK